MRYRVVIMCVSDQVWCGCRQCIVIGRAVAKMRPVTPGVHPGATLASTIHPEIEKLGDHSNTTPAASMLPNQIMGWRLRPGEGRKTLRE